ncbi:hypothetical protein [Hymenobacter convexus]|uniref:hypothetical protein n=1 Tax=Hymenobacter sp. CA1UV-4 TaxID=3063782 RepID=UPI002712A764|nr:hypothetical protein [Hymenobacter sp. CA1UV-4]MDO7854424.1 hypothetical protein [Hymenobacter sp. CA1UV-4]
MPLPLIALAQLGMAAAPSIYKGISGLFQSDAEVKKRDTTPEAFKEGLALTRQAAASNRLPGQSAEENRIAQQTAGVQAAAQRAGGSSSDILAALGASDARQQQALAALGVRGEAYHQQQQGVLRQGLAQQAAYQQRDQDNFDRERGALKEAGQRNIYGAVDGLSQLGVYALGKYGGGDTELPVPGSSKPRRPRSMAFGLPVPDGLAGLIG